MSIIEVFYQGVNEILSVAFEAEKYGIREDGSLFVGDYANPTAIFAPEVWLFAQKSPKTD